MLSIVRGIVSSPITRVPCALSQSTPRVTISLPVPTPCTSVRTARGPIHPSAPERCSMLNATSRPRSSRQSIAPSAASSIAYRQIEKWHADTDHAVAPISLRERVAEYLIEIGHVVDPRAKRALDDELAPGAGDGHQSAAPTWRSTSAPPTGGSASTRDVPDSSSYSTVIT